MTAVPKITQLDAALHYAALGWQVFPANPRTKAPLTENGMKDATADIAVVRRWWQQYPDALIACRIPLDKVVLDVDPRHGGDSTWSELERAYAPIEPRRTHTSGRNDGGAHHWFDRPVGKLSARKLHDWARANGVGQAAGERSWTSGIDILHHDHRYSILPPSPHPDTGDPYLWQKRDEPGPVPGFLAQLITADPTPAERTPLRPVYDSDSIADWYSTSHTWHDIIPTHGWVLVSGDGDSDGSKWRHPNASAESSATVRHGCLFVYSPNTDFPVTEQGDPHGVTRFRAWTILEHSGNGSDAARAAYRLRDGDQPAPVDLASLIAPQAAVAGRNLPDEFWNARPILQHIRAAAHNRARCADAVLIFTLARVAALTPPLIRLPAIAGAPASLNFLAAIISSSGGGKSTANDVARALLPIDRKDVVADVPPGSGEGLTELFFEWVTEEGDDGKKHKVKRQTKTGALIYLDEGQALAEMGSRKGATLLPTLRSAWSGAVIGQSNATQETHRVLAAHSYRMAIMIGFQLEYAAGLIDDAPGGTPQRFVFATATDPSIPDEPPEWPGEIYIRPPALVPGGTEFDFDRDVAAEIRQRQLLAARGEWLPDPLDTHADLVRMKLAALLALLDGRLNVSVEDWELAGQVQTASTAVRTWITDSARASAQRKEEARTAVYVRQAAALEDNANERAVTRCAQTIAHRVHKLAPDVTTRRDLSRAVAANQRAGLDDGITFAIAREWIKETAGGWLPGESKPTR